MKTAIGCFIGLILSVSIDAESLLEGRVWLDSGEPVADAQVRLFDLTDLRRGAIAHVMTDGTGSFALPLAALTERALPERFALGPNYPNPFNPSTIIPYQLAASSEVRLEVFNLLGQHVATLVDGERPAGSHTATWHATDVAGRAVGAGVYIYRMTVGVESQTGRMVLIDGQAGVSAAGAASVWSGVSGGGEGAQVYGLIISGRGLVPYVDSSFRVEAGMAPVELVVSAGQHPAGKATDDDCALCDLFGTFNDQQEEEDDETQEEEAATDSTSSAGGPDLIVQSPSASAVLLTPGQAFTLHVTVHNQGDQQAAATMLHYYRSNNSTITASDTEVGTDAVDALDASATSEESIELTASVGVERYYGACVTSVSGESNIDNNCSSAVRITVSGQEATEDSTETETDPADSTATTQTDNTEGSEGLVQVDSTSIEGLDDTQRFNIQLVFAPDIIEEDRQVFQDAARRWEEVIIGDLSDEEITDSVGSEWMDQVIKENPVVDDLLVFVIYNTEPYGPAAFANPRWNRTQGGDVNLCAVGEIQFSPELRTGEEKYGRPNILIYNIALHEIGHLVGIGLGVRWDELLRQITDPSLYEDILNNKVLPNDTHWVGPQAIAAYDDLGGDAYQGKKVPVWQLIPIHWRGLSRDAMSALGLDEEIRSKEVISTVSAAALADMGHEIDFSQAVRVPTDHEKHFFQSAGKANAPTDWMRGPAYWCGVGLEP